MTFGQLDLVVLAVVGIVGVAYGHDHFRRHPNQDRPRRRDIVRLFAFLVLTGVVLWVAYGGETIPPASVGGFVLVVGAFALAGLGYAMWTFTKR